MALVIWKGLHWICGEGDGTPTPVLLPGKSHGRRSLVGCSPWGREESDTTEHLHFHFSLFCIRGGNGNPLQCSCLENPRDRGAWWAAIYRVAQSRTWLKRLSSSSSSSAVSWGCGHLKGGPVLKVCFQVAHSLPGLMSWCLSVVRGLSSSQSGSPLADGWSS